MKQKFLNIIMMVMIVMFATAAIVCVHPAVASAEIRFGVLPRLSTKDVFVMFNPLAEYLTKETGEKVTLVITKDFDAFKHAVQSGSVEMAFSNPLIYVQLKKHLNLEPLALASEAKSGTRFRGIIITRKDSAINKLHDLKGKRLIFVDKDSAAGYIFQMMLLSKIGIEKDFTLLPFAKKHDNVTMAVFNRAADAGGIREDDLDKMKDKVDLSQIRIVDYTDYFPNWPVFATSHMNRAAVAKIKAALLKLKPDDPGSEKILGAAKLNGFVHVWDKDYDELRKAAKVAGAL